MHTGYFSLLHSCNLCLVFLIVMPYWRPTFSFNIDISFSYILKARLTKHILWSLMCSDLQHISHNVSFAQCQSLNEQKVATASCWSIDWNGQCWNEICSLNTDRLQLLYLSLSVKIMIWVSLVPHWTVNSRTYRLNRKLITNLVVMDDVHFLRKFLYDEW